MVFHVTIKLINKNKIHKLKILWTYKQITILSILFFYYIVYCTNYKLVRSKTRKHERTFKDKLDIIVKSSFVASTSSVITLSFSSEQASIKDNLHQWPLQTSLYSWSMKLLPVALCITDSVIRQLRTLTPSTPGFLRNPPSNKCFGDRLPLRCIRCFV